MLVLSRKPTESIMIGDEIEIKVLSCNEERIRLGITAPKALSVHREEVYRRILDALKSDESSGPSSTSDAA